MVVEIPKDMLVAYAKHIKKLKKEEVEKKAILLISWTRRTGESFSEIPLLEFVSGKLMVVNKEYYQPLIDKVAELLKKEFAKLAA